MHHSDVYHTPVHFEIPADSVDELAGFYTEVFGWQIDKVQDMDYWFVQTAPRGEGLNGGMLMRRSPEHRGALLFIYVDSVDDFVRKIKENGGTIVAEKTAIPEMGWLAVFVDPQGTHFGLWQDDESAA